MSALSTVSKTLLAPLAYAGFATASKSVGAGFRMHADQKAPGIVKNDTYKRELTMLGMVFAFNTAVQALTHKAMPGASQNARTLVNFIATLPATAAAEIVSRKVGKEYDWAEITQANHTAREESEDQLTTPARLDVSDRLQVLGDVGKHLVASAAGNLLPAQAVTPSFAQDATASFSPTPAANFAQTAFNPFAAYNNVSSPLLGFSGNPPATRS